MVEPAKCLFSQHKEGKMVRPERFERPTLRFVVSNPRVLIDTHEYS